MSQRKPKIKAAKDQRASVSLAEFSSMVSTMTSNPMNSLAKSEAHLKKRWKVAPDHMLSHVDFDDYILVEGKI